MVMVPELNMTREHGATAPRVVSQRRTSRDQWLILVLIILVNIVCSVTLLEMKMMKVRFQTTSPCWQAQVICTCVLTRDEMKSHLITAFFVCVLRCFEKAVEFCRATCTISRPLYHYRGVGKQKSNI